MIAQVPVTSGGKVEVAAVAVWWSASHVEVEWADETRSTFHCRVPQETSSGLTRLSGAADTCPLKRKKPPRQPSDYGE